MIVEDHPSAKAKLCVNQVGIVSWKGKVSHPPEFKFGREAAAWTVNANARATLPATPDRLDFPRRCYTCDLLHIPSLTPSSCRDNLTPPKRWRNP
nr:hypothetical protein CFP56_13074 [Quercus suber]